MILAGNLSTELLTATIAKAEERTVRNKDGRIVQKYSEIYGSEARRQIEEDEEDEKRVVNIRAKRIENKEKKAQKARQKRAKNKQDSKNN